jgi:hypothetical protein
MGGLGYRGHIEKGVLGFLSLWQITARNNLKGGKIYFGFQFQRFQSMIGFAPLLCACAEAKHQGSRRVWQSKVTRLIASKKQSEPQEGARDKIYLCSVYPQWPASSN